jgi:putative cell wall-binding protein
VTFALRTRLLALVLIAALLVPATAAAKSVDYLERDASGNGVYEAMAIQPNALFDPVGGRTYVAYQGYELDPYVSAYDHATDGWTAPVRVGTNPLEGDTHGGPAMVMDQSGYLHLFYGSHGGAGYTANPALAMRHATSAQPRSLLAFDEVSPVRTGEDIPLDATYPQPFVLDDGTIRLFFRNGAWTAGAARRHDWAYADYDPVASEWSTRTVVVDATQWPSNAYKAFYANFSMGTTETAHAAITWRDWRVNDAFERRDLYYIRQFDGGRWLSVVGSQSVDVTATAPPPWTLETLKSRALVPGTLGARINQVVVHEGPDGNPAILFLKQSGSDPVPWWTFARWDGAAWQVTQICPTDNLFDAGDFEITSSGDVNAYLVTGGTPDETAQATDRFAARGGDITQWRLSGSTWTYRRTIIKSTGTTRRYNDPQIVRDYDDEAFLTFCEWNNDTTSFVHRVYLYGTPAGGSPSFRKRDITPRLVRLAGEDRVQTALRTSQRAYPSGFPTDGKTSTAGSTVILATSREFADALASTPLCATLRAPLLLNPPGALDPRVKAEIQRLGAEKVILLGGEAALSSGVRSAVAGIRIAGSSSNDRVFVERISGHNRYATARAVAARVDSLMGPRSSVVLASGQSFPDALSVAGLAGRKGYPILLTAQSELPTDTVGALKDLSPAEVLLVGGTAVVGTEPALQAGRLTSSVPKRLWGANRYATASAIAEESLRRGFDPERIVAVTGENYPDALTGGWFAARYGAIVTLATRDTVPQETAALMRDHFARVVDVYVLGGEAAVGPTVAAWYATGAQAVPE